MRIALVTREYPPDTCWGGIGKFYATFAERLAGHGCDVEVFTQGLHRSGARQLNGVLVHDVQPRRWVLGPRGRGHLAGMSSRWLGVFALSLAVEMRRKVLARHCYRPFDVIEGHEHLGINALLNRLHSRSFVAVTRYHTAYHSLVRRQLANWPPSRLIRSLEQASIAAADLRIAPSRAIDALTQADFSGVSEADAFISLFPQTMPSEPAPWSARDNLMVFVGRLMPGHKNPDWAAEAFVRIAGLFPQWRIEFAGLDIPLDGGDTGWQRCRRILDAVPGRFTYHGQLTTDDLSALYRRARILLAPSSFESFGLAALEAMSAGVVPVVPEDTALAEVAGPAGVLFRRESLEEFAGSIRSLLADENRQQQLSALAIRRAREAFDGQVIVERNLELFSRAIAERRSRKH